MNRKIASTRQRLTNLLAVVAVGAGITMGFSATADAAPRDRDVREARKEVQDERKDLKKARKEVRKADTKEERREARQNVREERKDVKKAKKDVQQKRRENRRDGNWNNNNNYNYNNRGTYNRGTYNNRNTNNGRYNSNSDYRSFTGTVTDVNSHRGFKLRVGNQSFDVLVNNQFPRGFDEGDVVRVYGLRNGDNNISNASVSIVNNR